MDMDLSTPYGRKKFAEEADRIRLTPEQFKPLLADQMEYTRKKYGLTKRYFASLFNINDCFYGKMAENSRTISATMLVNYCRFFNLDIASVTQEAVIDSHDANLREVAVLIGSLSGTTLKEIAKVIENSQETVTTKKRSQLLFEKMLKEKSD